MMVIAQTAVAELHSKDLYRAELESGSQTLYDVFCEWCQKHRLERQMPRPPSHIPPIEVPAYCVVSTQAVPSLECTSLYHQFTELSANERNNRKASLILYHLVGLYFEEKPRQVHVFRKCSFKFKGFLNREASG